MTEKKKRLKDSENFSSLPVMGYKKSQVEKNKLVIDEEIAPVVRAIFSMYLEGNGCQEIRNHLQRNKVMNPSAWAHYKGYIDNSRYGYDEDESKRYKWGNEMVSRILKNETYIGSTVHYRHRKANHKSKSKKQEKDKHLVIENTHEAIISKFDFERVQKGLGLHKKPVNKRNNVFIGIAKCGDCDGSMKLGQSTRVRKRDNVEVTRKHLSCLNNNKYGKAVCTCHYTDYYELEELTLYVMNETINQIKMNEGELMKNILKLMDEESQNKNKLLKDKLQKLEKREKDIESIFIKLYEDRALGNIQEDNYILLSTKYTTEKEELQEQILEIREILDAESKAENNAKNFIDLVKDMQEIKELDEDIINTLIDKIVIYNSDGKGKNKKQKIDIHFKFIGNVNLEGGEVNGKEK